LGDESENKEKIEGQRENGKKVFDEEDLKEEEEE